MRKTLLAAVALSLLAAPAMAASWDHDNHGHDNHDNDHHAIHHGWKTGQRLPAEWRNGHDVDWRAHHLRQPPRGYHWVQTDGDYVLAAVATGAIMSAILANQ
ncbi:MAG TPA: RcnB family protein [Rhizomicrobium sp.]|jgi:Ni/Co efflux regulator RcnB